MKVIIWVLLLLQQTLLCQEFLISNIYTRELITNQHTSDIYFRTYGVVPSEYWVANMRESSIKPSPYKSLPVFSPNTNKLVYRDSAGIHLIDYDRGTEKIFSEGDPVYLLEDASIFSPNEEYVYLVNSVYSFKDSLLFAVPRPGSLFDWSSDTTITFIQPDRSSLNTILVEYSIYSGKAVDTIFTFSEEFWDGAYNGYTYDVKRNRFYYSISIADSSVFYEYDRNNDSEKIIFQYPDDLECSFHNPVKIDIFNFSKDYGKLIFSLRHAILSATEIMVYQPDSGKVIPVTEDCTHYGYKYDIYWGTSDTIVYIDATQQEIYGIEVPSGIVSVKDNKEELFLKSFSVSSYPNPFNGSTVIQFQIEAGENAELEIFNALGERVKTFNPEMLRKGENKIKWDGTDDANAGVSTGIYLAVLKLNSGYKKSHKLIYLK